MRAVEAAHAAGFIAGNDQDRVLPTPQRCFTSCSIAGAACVLATLWLQALAGTDSDAVVVFLEPRRNPGVTNGVTYHELRMYKEEPAAFGPGVPRHGLLGSLQLASPNIYACSNLTLDRNASLRALPKELPILNYEDDDDLNDEDPYFDLFGEIRKRRLSRTNAPHASSLFHSHFFHSREDANLPRLSSTSWLWAPSVAPGNASNRPLAPVLLVKRSPPLGHANITAAQRCTFTEKVLAAQRAGASAVVVFDYATGDGDDDDNGDKLIQMGAAKDDEAFADLDDSYSKGKSISEAQNIMIPAVFISRRSGEQLAEILATRRHAAGQVPVLVHARASNETELTIIALMSAFGLTLAICTSMVVCAGIFMHLRGWPENNFDGFGVNGRDVGAGWRGRLTTAQVRSLPSVTIPASAMSAAETGALDSPGESFVGSSCSICLADYLRGDSLKVLQCGHAFHESCVVEWLTRRRGDCPNCRQRQFRNTRPTSQSPSEGREIQQNSGGSVQVVTERSPLLFARTNIALEMPQIAQRRAVRGSIHEQEVGADIDTT